MNCIQIGPAFQSRCDLFETVLIFLQNDNVDTVAKPSDQTLVVLHLGINENDFILKLISLLGLFRETPLEMLKAMTRQAACDCTLIETGSSRASVEVKLVRACARVRARGQN